MMAINRYHALLTKLRVIYIPFLGISAGFVTIYSVLNAFLIMKWEILPLNESVSNLWLPFALACAPIFVILRSRLKVLKLTEGERGGLFLFLAWMAITIPTIVAQDYLATATGTMTRLTQISQIESKELTKYYSVGRVFANKALRGSVGSVELIGRDNQSLKISFFFACPLQDGIGDSTPADRRVWIGVKLWKIISSRISQARVEEEYNNYFNTCTSTFGAMDLRDFTYLERMTHNDDRKSFEAAVRNSSCSPISKDPIIVVAHDDLFESRNGSKLFWVFGAFAIGAGIYFIALLFPAIDDKEARRILSGRRSKANGVKEGLGYFYPRPGLFVTPILLDANIIVFAAMVLSGLGVESFQSADLVKWGADYGPLVRSGEYWRLLTCMFLHGGLMHLAGNLYGLMFAGVFLERLVPRSVFGFTYFASGLCASITSISVNDATVSVGASGAIFGLYGLLLFLLMTKDRRVKLARNPILISTVLFVGINLFSGLTTQRIDNAAHVGGLLSGIVLGVIYRFSPYSAIQPYTAKRKGSSSVGESVLP